MPQNPESSIPLDDDDILDLTEVAEPGKGADGPPEPGNGGADFGADLDALLDSLAPDGTVSAPASPSSAAAPESPVAAPIKDQTPVAHQVDPNEEMAMPETSDIDSLLAELGADIPTDAFDPPAEEAPAPKAAAPVADFDNLLAQAQAAEAEKAAEEAAAPVAVAAEPEPAPEPVAAAQPVAAEPEPEPVMEEAPSASAPPAPEMEADDADSLDLNELDALLDDILATAPEMSVPAPAPAPAPAPTPVEAAVEAAGEAVAEEPVAVPAEDPMEMPVEMPVEAPVAAAPSLPEDDGLPDVIPVPEAALMPNDAPDASLEARIRRLEDAVEVLETEVNNQLSENMVDALIDAKIAALLAPGSAAVATIVDAVLAEVVAPEAEGENAAIFREKLEKMAAAAAAKVIREEIAALMNE